MKHLSLALGTLALGSLLIGCSSTCAPVSEARTKTIVDYVISRYRLAKADEKRVTIGSPIGGSCLRPISFPADGEKRNVIYLTGDQAYLTPAIFDLSRPPVVSDRPEKPTSHSPASITLQQSAMLALHSPSIGNRNARVTIVEFSDFECPFCKRFATGVRASVASGTDVRLVYKFFPLEFHPWAKQAAKIGYCVNQESPDAFWGLHDYIYAHQSELHPSDLGQKLSSYIKQHLHINQDVMDKCINAATTEHAIQEDIDEGAELGVTGTPTSFVNGTPFIGARDISELNRLIADHLQRDSQSVVAADKR